METFEAHEAANIFPIDDENIGDLAEDIKKNGQQVPVELIGGKVVDGRRRLKACGIAGVEPSFVEVSPADPIAYVLSLNLHRRHLTVSQRAACAARAHGIYEREARERQLGLAGTRPNTSADLQANWPEGARGQARDKAGKAFGVSGKSVDRARRVIEKGTPELVQAVDSGRMTVTNAAKVASAPPEVQREAIEKRGKRSPAKVTRKPEAPEQKEEPTKPLPDGRRGVGVEKAHKAIAALREIPPNDALRSRGFQIVSDWMNHNK